MGLSPWLLSFDGAGQSPRLQENRSGCAEALMGAVGREVEESSGWQTCPRGRCPADMPMGQVPSSLAVRRGGSKLCTVWRGSGWQRSVSGRCLTQRGGVNLSLQTQKCKKQNSYYHKLNCTRAFQILPTLFVGVASKFREQGRLTECSGN